MFSRNFFNCFVFLHNCPNSNPNPRPIVCCRHVFIYSIHYSDEVLKKRRPQVLDRASRHHPHPVLRLQRRPVLRNLHPIRNSSDFRLRPNHPENNQVPLRGRPLTLDLPVLHPNLHSPSHPLPLLHSTY
jgi:hypothetical protein